MVEEQDIVYRDAAPVIGSAPVEPIDDIGVRDEEWSVPVDPTLLFRFSALTYNGHRIHYDREYAREVEGYAGLVVHGSLQALTMAEAARARGATGLLSIDYRLVSPLMGHQGMVVTARPAVDVGWDTSVRDRSGRTSARGTVTPLSGA